MYFLTPLFPMLPSQFIKIRSLVLYGFAAHGALVAMFCIAVAMLLTCCQRLCCGPLTEFLGELVCKRLHVCGSDHVFQIASTRSELLDPRSATMRKGTLILSGNLEPMHVRWKE